MKKLVAISVLLAGLAAAVFAQDDEGKWKVGFKAQFVTDMLSATSVSGKSETSVTGSATETTEYGKLNKGTVNFFGNKDNPWHSGPGQRLLLSIANSGENYDVYLDMKLDDWVSNTGAGTGGNEGWGGKFIELINAGNADWYAKGTAGIFNAQVGTAGYGGWVSTQATWNDWLGWNNLCRFGVWRAAGPDGGFLVGDDFRTWNQWGSIFALGAGLGDNFKLSLGYRINPNWGTWNPNDFKATESKSSINGSFMLNGRVSEAIAFDLFYSIIGKDNDTYARPVTGQSTPSAYWENIIGAYVGLNIVENLGLSLGYTANFDVYETGSYIAAADAGDPTKAKQVDFTAPFYSGIDIHLSYSGIDKIGLNFNNNISLASVKGEEIKPDSTKVILDFSKSPYDKDKSQDWFHWNSELKATFALVENLGLTLHLGNQLGVRSSESETEILGTKIKSTRTDTSNDFRVSLFADYGIGAVKVGIGLDLGITSTASEFESTGSTTRKETGNSDVTYFGIPIMFKVQF